ncbi:VCBS repeat-containing protein [Balneolaceae bacterium YR4-1]|uniref:VCBS repeat-containing protein n=1 Tax=Halalkalibaculum roseum TaxID=2709311 RepID=A0A6M1T1U2_9BACT|nr:VCBS repeat-containing protein [Halalkalibaculum roseum]NGP76005.1 VCBS repeat-containing protein [Halalkalibaculum roseum]
MIALRCNAQAILFIIILTVFAITGCSSDDTMFKRIPPSDSGIIFQNSIAEDESNNPLVYEYLYNGGGVAVADFNNDGLQDLYFTGNMVSNKLYLNEGDLQFSDVTKPSGTAGSDKWYTGVSVVDINGDGLQDIYVCAGRWNEAERRENELYINQGMNEDGIPEFIEQSSEYGLNDDSHSTQAAFFDYDNDGDLDLYLLVSDQRQKATTGGSRADQESRESPNLDRLYRNDWNEDEKRPMYVEVGDEAGITKDGYGLGVNISDLNGDGWKDIYVANDFASDDILWINNGDGTFRDEAYTYFKHTSFSSMGTDIQDVNNDGLPDVVTLDMLPENNFRKKTMTNPNNYINYARNAFGRIKPQYTRNTLQLNRGPRKVTRDSVAPPVFSEIAYLSGIAETDWSWGPLLADFDNDGLRDLLVTNGIPGDKTDKDFVNYRDRLGNIVTNTQLSDSIPEVKIPNYIYRNNGNLRFDDLTIEWGLDEDTYSNGLVWADLDNDGDLEIVINNINQDAYLYENTLNEHSPQNSNWLQVRLKGNNRNSKALDAKVRIYYGDRESQFYEYTPYRGYLSSVENMAHFGLGSVSKVDSLVVSRSTGEHYVWKDIEVNQKFEADLTTDGETISMDMVTGFSSPSWFREVSDERNITYEHEELEYDDFMYNRLMPHKLSQYGPSLAVGDIDNNGTQDLFAGGSYDNQGTFFLQDQNGEFTTRELPPDESDTRKTREDEGTLLFDAENDGDLDLYIVSGSVENRRGSDNFQDRFYENDGEGRFSYRPEALPDITESGMAVRASDFDRDGDLDLFVGGRVVPNFYPLPASSYLLRNDSESGEIVFTDVTPDFAEPLREIGMISDALWTDFDNDGWTDLILAGEWMPLTFLKNREGKLVDITDESGISQHSGWWNSLAGGDFDRDGDIDYIAGNLGLNSLYQGSAEEPVSIYGKDFSEQGLFTGLPTTYIPDAEGMKKEFPVHPRDEVLEMLRRRDAPFQSHANYGRSTLNDIFTEEDLKDAVILRAQYFESAYIENLGEGKFAIRALPVEAQFAPLFGMIVDDFNADGNPDVLLNGNDYGAQVQIGGYDALNGLLLKGDGAGNFEPLSIAESGIFIPGDGKALVKVQGADGSYLAFASQNSGPMKVFRAEESPEIIPFEPMDAYAIIYFENGASMKQEAYYGSSFQSASGRFMALPSEVDSVEIVDYSGEKRSVVME